MPNPKLAGFLNPKPMKVTVSSIIGSSAEMLNRSACNNLIQIKRVVGIIIYAFQLSISAELPIILLLSI